MSETTHDDHPPVPEPDDTGGGHGNAEHEEHGNAAGPIDWRAWGAGLLGVGAGLAVAVCLYAATAL
jgi:hypothetical protein